MLPRIVTIDPAKQLSLLVRWQTRGLPVAGLERSAFNPTPGFDAASSHLYIVVRLKPYDATTDDGRSPSRTRSTAMNRMVSSVR
jgi:hypothetical protein